MFTEAGGTCQRGQTLLWTSPYLCLGALELVGRCAFRFVESGPRVSKLNLSYVVRLRFSGGGDIEPFWRGCTWLSRTLRGFSGAFLILTLGRP